VAGNLPPQDVALGTYGAERVEARTIAGAGLDLRLEPSYYA